MNRTEQAKHGKLNLLLLIGLLGVAALIVLWAAAAARQTATAAPVGAQSVDGIWQDVNEAALRIGGDRVIMPTAYRTVSLDWDALNGLLANAPDAAAEGAASDVILYLPLPDGTYGRFQITNSPVMHPDLAAKFPEIQTYAGFGLDDPTAYARLDTTPKGFHAMILSGNSTVFIDPYSKGETGIYLSYFKTDFETAKSPILEPEVASLSEIEELTSILEVAISGSQLRTYRLAVATTVEYTAYHSANPNNPTVSEGMSAVVTTINRVMGIYERDVAVTFQLVANNNLIIHTAEPDGYTNGSDTAMVSENQTKLDSVILSANYDIGHVFGTGPGGYAPGDTCVSSTKAQGMTSTNDPIGDPFDVDYVAHEIGHQLGANHTFNSSICSAARWAPTAYEPGSGSTIMAYAGICPTQNIQMNSDDYFHGISIQEIVTYTTVGTGSSCGTVENTGNNSPTIEAGGSYNIPLNTPFTLTGSATDPGDELSLTYNWEEFDTGPAGHPNAPSGNAPIFRSFPATSSPSRTFPRMSDIVNNTQTIGEILPSYARTMNFRLTVRDNQATGGVAYDSTTVTAVANTGPFLVTAPNTAVTWTGNTNQTVTWNVAGTTASPISCANVNIHLSTDGGFTYPTVLLSNTPNDGSASVFVPNLSTSTARVRVSCANNIFFDISNANFTIQLGVGGDPSLTVSKTVQPVGSVTSGATLTYTIAVTNTGTAPANNTTVTDTFATALVNPTCNGVPGNLNQAGVSLNPTVGVHYTCTAQVDPSLALAVDITAVPHEILSGEQVTYTIAVTNSHSSLSLNNVQVSAPGLSNCSPALTTPQTLTPGAGQTYTCPNNVVNSPASRTATATGSLTISNVANASDPDDPGGPASSNTVQSQVVVTGSDSVMVILSDYNYLNLPLIIR